MEHRWKRLISYYKPYRGLFLADTFFFIFWAGISLAIPLIVRYITGNVTKLSGGAAFAFGGF